MRGSSQMYSLHWLLCLLVSTQYTCEAVSPIVSSITYIQSPDNIHGHNYWRFLKTRGRSCAQC